MNRDVNQMKRKNKLLLKTSIKEFHPQKTELSEQEVNDFHVHFIKSLSGHSGSEGGKGRKGQSGNQGPSGDSGEDGFDLQLPNYEKLMEISMPMIYEELNNVLA